MKNLDPPIKDTSNPEPGDGKAKTRKDLAIESGMSVSSFYRKLKAKGYPGGIGLLSPKEQRKIKKLLGQL
jgi:hypothetical protein